MDLSVTLPEEVWLHIFCQLDTVALCRAAQVCRHWSSIINGAETLWKSKCLALADPHIKQNIMLQTSQDNRPWKEAYKDNYGDNFTKRQWLEGKISHVSSWRDLPYKAFGPVGLATWAEILEHELKR